MATDHKTKALQWVKEHPETMSVFEELAAKAVSSKKKFGIGFLAERVRWEYQVVKQNNDFKINNNYRAYIARELVARHPEWRNFIEMRHVNCW